MRHAFLLSGSAAARLPPAAYLIIGEAGGTGLKARLFMPDGAERGAGGVALNGTGGPLTRRDYARAPASRGGSRITSRCGSMRGAYHDFDVPRDPVRDVFGLPYTLQQVGMALDGENRAGRDAAQQAVCALLASLLPAGQTESRNRFPGSDMRANCPP